MHIHPRFARLIVLGSFAAWFSGCSGGDSSTSPVNQVPTVAITSNPGDSLFFNETANFSWQGNDPDGTIASYYAGLDSNFTQTTNTSASYGEFSMGESHVFYVYAVDNQGASSETKTHAFGIRPYPPVNFPPEVNLVSGPEDSIFANQNAVFIWEGIDPDDNIIGYHIALNDNWEFITNTTVAYANFTPGESHLFQVAAEDAAGEFSDTSEWTFNIVTAEIVFTVFGQGTNDSDGDQYWTGFDVRWCPQITIWDSYDLRLFVWVQSTLGGLEWSDSSDVEQRNPGDSDTLAFSLPIFTQGTYNIRVQLRQTNGTTLFDYSYGSIPSLTNVMLEELEGFVAWFEDVWTANYVDLLPPFGYYESFDLWWNVDSYPDAGIVRVVVYERNTAGIEYFLNQYDPYWVNGINNQDPKGFQIIAGVATPDSFDYRLELWDNFNHLLDEITYGEIEELMNIPLGAGSSGGSSQTKAKPLSR